MEDLVLTRCFPPNLAETVSREAAMDDIEWITNIRDRLRGMSEFYAARVKSMPNEIIRSNLDEAAHALNLVISNDLRVSKSSSPQEKMKVLPEQILAWLKSTFGQDEANQQDDKKRTFRGVVAAMRVISGFRGKKLSRDQSGLTFGIHTEFSEFCSEIFANMSGYLIYSGCTLIVPQLISKFWQNFGTIRVNLTSRSWNGKSELER